MRWIQRSAWISVIFPKMFLNSFHFWPFYRFIDTNAIEFNLLKNSDGFISVCVYFKFSNICAHQKYLASTTWRARTSYLSLNESRKTNEFSFCFNKNFPNQIGLSSNAKTVGDCLQRGKRLCTQRGKFIYFDYFGIMLISLVKIKILVFYLLHRLIKLP